MKEQKLLEGHENNNSLMKSADCERNPEKQPNAASFIIFFKANLIFVSLLINTNDFSILQYK